MPERPKHSLAFRLYFLSIAALVVIGIMIEIVVSAHRQGGYFDTPLARVLNLFAYFTILSNTIVGVTSFILATKTRITSNLFWGFRLSGLAAIIITFIVQYLLLRGHTAPGWPQVSDTIVHIIVPIMTLLGWLVFGPRGHMSKQIVALSTAFPITWIGFTLIRGHLTNWYPYDFINAGKLGYLIAFRNITIVIALFGVIILLAKFFDSRATTQK